VSGWTEPLVIGGFLLAVLMAIGFLAIERRSDHPLLPLGYLRRRNFTFPIATQFFTNFAYMGGFIVTPLFLQNEFHCTFEEDEITERHLGGVRAA
jgi:hypothetical protein